MINFKKNQDIQLTKNFNSKEIQCKCQGLDCVNQKISKEHMEKLQTLRDRVGKLKITSAFRCEAHNKKVGGSSKSTHKLGLATDIVPLEMSIKEVLKICMGLFNGVGDYSSRGFIHVDSRSSKVYFKG